MSLTPRAVVVHRPTEYDELIARHGTRGQAAFFLSSRGRHIEEVERRRSTLARDRALHADVGRRTFRTTGFVRNHRQHRHGSHGLVSFHLRRTAE